MKKFYFIIIQFLFVYQIPAQSFYYDIDFDTVKAQKFDMGKMWTFENPPIDYFEELYGLRLTKEWFDKVQKAALKFSSGCSPSFIS